METANTEEGHIYLQLAQKLRNGVHAGKLTGRLPGIRELARQYAVNFKTANRAVTTLVSEGLLYRLKGKGTFVVDESATKSDLVTVGLILPDIVNPYFAKLAQSLQRAAVNKQIALIVNTNYQEPAMLAQTLRLYRTRGVQAIIVQGGVVHSEKSLTAVRKCGIPLVGTHTHIAGLDDVRPDVQAGAQMATEHLLDSFGPEVAFICGSDEPITMTGRYAGFRDALLSRGHNVQQRFLVKAPPTYKGGYDATMELMQQKHRPRSVFVYNQIMAMGVISALTHLGIGIPREVAVAGCDDSVDESEMLVPTTSVAFSFDECANLLISLVGRRLRYPEAEAVTYRVAPKLVVRASTTVRGKSRAQRKR